MNGLPTPTEHPGQAGAVVQLADAMSLSLLFALGRQYLDVPFEDADFLQMLPQPPEPAEPPHFLRLEQVGNPLASGEEQPLTALQTALSACHDPARYSLLFAIASDGRENRIYLGVRGHGAGARSYAFVDYLGHFLGSNWPGTRLRRCDHEREVIPRLLLPMSRRLQHATALTGIPSLKPGDHPGYPQSLDRLLRGLRGRPFLYLVVAEPMPQTDVSLIVHRARDLIGRIHTLSRTTRTETLTRGHTETRGTTDTRQESTGHQLGRSRGSSRQVGVNLSVAALLGAAALSVVFPPAALVGAILGPSVGSARQQSESTLESGTTTTGTSLSETTALSASVAEAVGREYLNAHAQAGEEQLRQYAARFEQARTLGCWNVGVYFLAEDADTAQQGSAQLRALLSGEKSSFEPIRAHNLSRVWTSGEYSAQVALSGFEQPCLALVNSATREQVEHPLGPAFGGLTTPLNTQELALLVNLPQREVPGVRVLSTASFSLNPPSAHPSDLVLGSLLEGAEPTPLAYSIAPRTLAKHALVTGITGSGKTTTCHRLLGELNSRGIPFLVIEPAKDEYVEWAMQRNDRLPSDSPDRIAVYVPGAQTWRGRPLEDELVLNPLDVVWLAEGGQPQVLSHVDRVKSIFNASFPMQEVLPILLEELLFYSYHTRGWLADELPAVDAPRPTLAQLVNQVGPLIRGKGYEDRISANLAAALTTRLQSLRRGWKGRLFDQPRSTPWPAIFDRPAIVNLTHLGDDADKAFTMAVLLQFLHEYRQAQHEAGAVDRQSGQLRHLAVIEEAHRVLRRTASGPSEQANPEAKVAEMFANALAEIRAYGQGLLIVDQVPAKLVPDAIKNTNLKIVHRLVASDDRDAMASCMALTPEQAAVINGLRPGQAIVHGDQDDSAAWVQVLR